MAAVMLFVVSFYGQIGYGPLFEEAMKEAIVPPCQKYWWNNLFYINNMYPSSLNDGCINWVWYLANDMQFYILSPIYLLLFYKYPKVGLGVVGFTIVGSAAITGALSNHFNIPADAMSFTYLFRFLLDLGSPDISVPDLEANDSFWNETYVRPWCRIGVYVIGMATGYVIHVTKRKIKMNEVFVTLMWMAVIAVELTIIYGFVGPIVHGYYPTNNIMYFYNAVSRPVWALGLSWVTIACVTGYGGLINSFLSWKFFIPLSRLTYCAYLVHVLIVLYMYSSREYEMHFAVNIIVYYYLDIYYLCNMVCLRSVLLILVILNGIQSSSAASDVIPRHPPYLPRGSVERLVDASNQDFYKVYHELLETKIELNEDNLMKKLLRKLEREYENNECDDAIIKAILNYFGGKSYARQMYDSMGRRESGLLRGNYLWTGSYFECFDSTNGEDITAHMCQAILSGQPNASVATGLTLGICVPDVCTGTELTSLLQSTFLNDTPGIFVNVKCPEYLEYDAVDITFFVIVGVLGLLVISGTLFEITTARIKNDEEGSQKDMSIPGKMIMSFSVISNTKTLLSTDLKDGSLECLHGLRFISMTWVILGHSFSTSLGFTDNIIDACEYFVSHGAMQAIANGTLSVDTFFFLSGLLVAYLGLRGMEKNDGKMNVPLMYLSRYLRLTPCYAFIILFYVGLYEKIGYGLFYQPAIYSFAVKQCEKYWWTNLLYINNLYPLHIEDECYIPAWYLANDMQFYLLSPIFLLLFYRYPKAGLGAVIGTVLGSAAITGALSTYYNVGTDVIDLALLCRYILGTGSESDETPPPTIVEDPYFYDIYAKPWCRIGAYVIGMATGYFIHKTKRKIKLPEVFVTLMWIAVAAVLLATVYGFCGPILYNYTPSMNLMSFYNAVSRPVWALGLAWVTIACVSGYGGPINTFLSWKLFIPLSRLTYCAYLIHPVGVMYLYLAREHELHFEVNIVTYYFLALLTLSYALAFVLSISLEIPMTGLIKLMLSQSKSGKKEEEKTNRNQNQRSKKIQVNDYGMTNGHFESTNDLKQEIDNGYILEESDHVYEKL